jgi:uncharacterized membrane protein
MLRAIFRYAAPLASLTLGTAGFLRARGYRPLGKRTQPGLATLAALPLFASGTMHLVRPEVFVPLLPEWVPGRVLLIVVAGLPELVGGCALFFPATRRWAAAGLAAFMILIFPANVYVAGETVSGLQMPGVTVRTAMQAAYILLLLVVGNGVPIRE